MPDTHLQRTIKQQKPQATAAELIECIETYDMGLREGKRALWRLLASLGPYRKSEFMSLSERYRSQRFSIRDSNRLAALDIATDLPTAHELPEGLLSSLRPGGDEKEPEGGRGAYKARDEAEAKAKEASSDEAVSPLRVRKRSRTVETQFDRLLVRVQECSQGKRTGVGRSVAWVSAKLRTPLDRIKAEDVPGEEALSLYMWARQNETEYRRLYDSKRIPSRGIAEDEEKGFIDTGEPIEDIISRIRSAFGSSADVSMRHLQAAESGGDDHQREGGVHGMSESSPSGGAASDPGRDGGSGSGSDGGAGADIQGSSSGGAGADSDAAGGPDTSAERPGDAGSPGKTETRTAP